MKRQLLKALVAITAATAFNASLPAAAPLDKPQLQREYIYPSSTALQGRRHPAYQVFVYQLQLPSIVVLDNRMVIINEAATVDSARLHRLYWRQREGIAFEFDIPQGVIDHWWASLFNRPALEGQALAQDLCATVTDYKYLAMRWMQYLAPAEMQAFKDLALESLEAGDLATAWKMYYSLPRPGTF